MSDDLVSKYLGGDAGDEDIARLDAAIQADPAVVDALFAGAELERDLVQAFRVTRRRRLLPFSLAAAGLLAASIGAAFFLAGPRDVARVDRLDGTAFREDGGPYRTGDAVGAIRTQGVAILLYADGTRLELGPGTVVRAIHGKRIDLALGLLKADVVKQPAGEPMKVRTDEGEAEVLGTRFTLSATPGSTRLAVEEGKIRLTRGRDAVAVDIPASHSATIAKDVPFAARRTTPDGWTSLPSSAMSRVAPDPAKFPKAQGTSGVSAVVGAWSGAAFDSRRERLVLWGGGYSDYHGNELYAFDLRTLSWERLTDPTPDPKLGQDLNDDGTPNGRATYNGLAYHARADRFFAFGGALAGGAAGGAPEPWTFDFAARRWTRKAPTGPRPAGGVGGASAYDPAGGKLWWADPTGIYSVDADRWTRHAADPVYYQTGAIDSRRGLWVLVGQGKALAVDLRTGRPQPWRTSGGDALLAKANPGFDYDPVSDRLVAWAGGPVWSLDPETKTWTADDAPGAPAATPNGIFGRWRYIPGLDAFVVVTAVDRPVHLYKPKR
jgi:hypothetical protein